MSNNDLKSLSELVFDAEGPLHDLAIQAARRTDLTGYLRAGLSAELRDHLRAGNPRPDGTLVIMADSPAWAARLRFEGGLLLARCREVHPEVQRIKVRVLADPTA
jgi:hypothetical protein